METIIQDIIEYFFGKSPFLYFVYSIIKIVGS